MSAYVPPHRRQNPGAEPEGDLPPFERISLYRTEPRMDIQYSARAITKLYMLCAEERKLRFQLSESGEHPIPAIAVGQQRYRLAAVDSHDRKEDCNVHQGQRITTRLEKDFRAALDEISNWDERSSLEPTWPTLWLRFGRITFVPDRANWNAKLENMVAFLPSEIEREHFWGGPKLWTIKTRKQLDPGLPREFFDKLQMLALQCGLDKVSIKEKETFRLKIGDQERNDSNIYCQCRSGGDTLKIICAYKKATTRLLVADFCWARKWDLRLMLAIDTVCVDISVTASPVQKLVREEKEGIEEIERAAIVDHLTALGFRWPASFIGRSGLVVKNVRHVRTKIVEEAQTGRVWKFTQDFQDGGSAEDVGVSWQVDLGV